MFDRLINLLLIQGEIIEELKTDKVDDKDHEKADAISAVKELLPIAEEIGQPGEYGSLKQRAWDAYHKHKSWEVW